MKSRINDVGMVLGGVKNLFSCRVMGMHVKIKLYEGVAVPTTLYVAKTWSMAVVDKKLVVMKMRCLRSMLGVMCMD